jgi:SAM-dependent methyltransferase
MAVSDFDKLRDDFDRIALLPDDGGGIDHNARYHDHLLRHVARDCRLALDIGCGRGAFARQLARRSERVIGIDLSPNMIRAARERSRDSPNVEFDVADVMSYDLGAGRFDCIASMATLHHLPLAELLPRLARALRPGGVLLVLDLRQSRGLVDRVMDCLALRFDVAARLRQDRRGQAAAESRRAWRDHGTTDHYLTLPEVREYCRQSLPGAIVRRHLMWRYSLIWQKHLSGYGNSAHPDSDWPPPLAAGNG